MKANYEGNYAALQDYLPFEIIFCEITLTTLNDIIL